MSVRDTSSLSLQYVERGSSSPDRSRSMELLANAQTEWHLGNLEDVADGDAKFTELTLRRLSGGKT